MNWKPFPVNDPRATCYSSSVFATLVHGVIGYKFCWLLPSEDQNQGTPAGHESNDAIAGESANFIVILFQCTFDFHHKFGNISFILLILIFFIVSLLDHNLIYLLNSI